MSKSGFHGRGLTSLIVVTSFLIMTITGIVLYFAPHGRVAYWIIWRFAWLTKTDWGNIHIISSIVFAIAGGFHIYFNWRAIINYFSGKIESTLKYKKELAASMLLSIFIIVGSINPMPPFNYVLDFGEYLKGIWVESKEYEPPYGHAEESSLKTFSKKMDIDLEMAVRELKARGMVLYSVKDKLMDIAINNNMTPMDVFIIIKKYEKKADDKEGYTSEGVEEKFEGTGIGNKPLSWITEDVGVPLELAKARLALNSIDAADDEKIKEIASKNNTQPIEVLKVILIEGYSIK
jgi:hypothetical protein